MSTFSDKFDNRWKCIPYSMSTLTTGNGFAILFHLLRRGHTENDITTCSISKKTLADLIGVSSSTVLRAIKNLEQLNLIEVVFNQGNISTFSINWEEIQKIHRVSMQLSDKGWLALREVCSENGVKPLSSISDKVIEMLIEKFPYTRTNMIWDPCQYDTTPYHNDTTPYHNDTTPCQYDMGTPENVVFSPDPCHIGTGQSVTHVNMERVGESIEDGIVNASKTKTTHINLERDPCHIDTTPYHNDTTPCHNDTTPCHNDTTPCQYDTTPCHNDTTPCHNDTQNKIYIDIENKENHNERSEFNKETDMKILEWFNSRDLSFPDLSSSDFETIINLPDFADNDFDMAIREVWGYLQYDEDSPGNYIPAEYFKDILYRAWNDLKTINPDFSLSEQDMKNIFGFDVEMQNGEPVCYVTPSKIKNINQSPSSSRKIKRKGVGDRTSRLIFLESIRQVAEKDTNMLTDAEYAIWLMIEFVKERESNQQPRPSEVTKAVYEDLLKRFSNESKVPVEDLRTLWKELPQKNTVKLHPQQLSVDKIINYNVQVNQASDVEELYNKKMAEQP
ncbi:winged helix-turn-helix transcriptional regulator [Bacteroides acidifaciens]|uniref:winged helix-turn-helix transcriptional regulator n=4 Tax=Bacteroides acidifaciens TaxID=85831 RepID=UPI00258F4E16|nr:helix-turn-helix domain-containing protein [Bacteroides acidifaciens]